MPHLNEPESSRSRALDGRSVFAGKRIESDKICYDNYSKRNRLSSFLRVAFQAGSTASQQLSGRHFFAQQSAAILPEFVPADRGLQLLASLVEQQQRTLDRSHGTFDVVGAVFPLLGIDPGKINSRHSHVLRVARFPLCWELLN